MKLASALVGIAALGGVALSSLPASAMTIIVPGQASPTSNVVQADYVATPGIAGIARITAVATTNRSTMAVGAGIVAGDGTAGIIGGEFERGFGPFLILAASTIHYPIRAPFH